MWETVSTDVFQSTILKVQLTKETGKKESMSKELIFVECAKEMIDSSEKEEETKVALEETGWSRVTSRTVSALWKRKVPAFNGSVMFMERRDI